MDRASSGNYIMARPAAPIPASISDVPSTNLKRRSRWRRVEAARNYINGQSKNIAKALVKQAIDGDANAAQWLLSHTVATDDNGAEVRPIAPSADRPQVMAGNGGGSNGPRIMIGVSLGSDYDRLNAPTITAHALPPHATPQVVSIPEIPSHILNDLSADPVLTSHEDSAKDVEPS